MWGHIIAILFSSVNINNIYLLLKSCVIKENIVMFNKNIYALKYYILTNATLTLADVGKSSLLLRFADNSFSGESAWHRMLVCEKDRK